MKTGRGDLQKATPPEIPGAPLRLRRTAKGLCPLRNPRRGLSHALCIPALGKVGPVDPHAGWPSIGPWTLECPPFGTPEGVPVHRGSRTPCARESRTCGPTCWMAQYRTLKRPWNPNGRSPFGGSPRVSLRTPGSTRLRNSRAEGGQGRAVRIDVMGSADDRRVAAVHLPVFDL